MSTSTVAVLDNAPDQLVGAIGRRLATFNDETTGWSDHRLVVVAHDEGRRPHGGLIGFSYGGWLSIDVLWVEDDWRGRGVGAAMMRAAEAEAIRRGCRGAHTDTFSFQAPGFYEKLGYSEFGRLEGFDGEFTRIYYRKSLV